VYFQAKCLTFSLFFGIYTYTSKRRYTMDRLEFAANYDATPAKRGRPKGSKKRKWRQIEIIQDKQRVARELNDMDLGHDYSINEIELDF